MFGIIKKIKNQASSNAGLEIGYCFYDIDGVLNIRSDWHKAYTFREDKVRILCRFCLKHNLIPVMTSTWRMGMDRHHPDKDLPHIRRILDTFQKYGIDSRYMTPKLRGEKRDAEINKFLTYHPVERYVIIDDDPGEYGHVSAHNVFTDSDIGLTDKVLEEAAGCIMT